LIFGPCGRRVDVALLEVLLAKLAETLVKFAVEASTGNKMAGELGAGATNVLGGRAAGLADDRRARRERNRTANSLANELISRYGHEYREVSTEDQAAAVQAVIDTFGTVGGGVALIVRCDVRFTPNGGQGLARFKQLLGVTSRSRRD
jgi:hypothetical protein